MKKCKGCDIVCVVHILPLRVPPSKSVDNGGDRSCQLSNVIRQRSWMLLRNTNNLNNNATEELANCISGLLKVLVVLTQTKGL